MAAYEEYGRRATEYIHHFGEIDFAHPADVDLITRWAVGVDGPVLDAGCGPGQWTAHLAELGVDIRGVDGAVEFVAHARRAHPKSRFDAADLDALPVPEASVAGVMAWYSLIHHKPAEIGVPLAEFARVLRPGGHVLIGFFVGECVDRFDHAVTPAYRWPVESLAERLLMAHFEVIETYTRTGPGHRPHGAIVARLSTRH